MYFDRFDIIAAHYLFCAGYYTGQNDKLYARLCRIKKYFNPGPLFEGYVSLSENGQVIYDNLVKKHNADG